MENVIIKYGKVRHLTCSCCGGEAIGRQWHNRDTGYGLCKKCIAFCARGESEMSMRSYYGLRGIHYDLPEQHEIDAQIEMALQTRLRNGYTDPAVVQQRFVGESFSLGFNFQRDVKVGDIVHESDGSLFVVLALV